MGNNFAFGVSSLAALRGVHPDLVNVCNRALELSSFDFGITEGVRTSERQQQLLDTGRSQTLKSNHIPKTNNTGYSHAIDFVAYGPDGSTYDPRYYKPILQAFVTAAIERKVLIRFGGLWHSFSDYPHVELDKRYYGS